ncbi:MAG: hypothetical protein GX130_05505 [Candidatus Hydrogenedens sp.]|jgi:hypothetical protein|nr:hypothetical protein [Candidatus Hydrogenedens sp.]
MNQSWLTKSIPLFILAALAGFFIMPAALSAGEPDPESILNSFRDSFNWMNDVAMHIESFTRVGSSPDEAEVFDFDCYIDGDRNFRTVGTRQDRNLRTGELTVFSHGGVLDEQFQKFFSRENTGGLYLQHSAISDDRGREDYLKVWEAGEDRVRLEQTLGHPFAIFSGYATGFSTQPLYDLLTPDAVTMREEINDGVRSCVLEATIAQGSVEIWLSPDQNYTLQKCILIKEAGKDFDAKGSEIYGGVDFFSEETIKRNIIEITVSETQSVDGRFIPRHIEYLYREDLVDDGVFEMFRNAVISEVDLSPDFEALGAFHFVVPEDTSVDFIKKDGTELSGFKWEDGKLIAPMDEQSVDTKLQEGLAAIHTTPSDNTKAPAKLSLLVNKLDSDAAAQMKEEMWLYILMAAGLIVLIGAWIAYRIVKRRRESQ